jgi:hypothetical protein
MSGLEVSLDEREQIDAADFATPAKLDYWEPSCADLLPDPAFGHADDVSGGRHIEQEGSLRCMRVLVFNAPLGIAAR